MVANDDLEGKTTHFTDFYIHTISGPNIPKPPIVMLFHNLCLILLVIRQKLNFELKITYLETSSEAVDWRVEAAVWPRRCLPLFFVVVSLIGAKSPLTGGIVRPT